MSKTTDEVETVAVELVQSEMNLYNNKFVKVDDDGIHFDELTPIETWLPATVGIFNLTRRSMRLAGQCLVFGERKYGESYAQALDPMKYSPKTLSNAQWVVSSIGDRWHNELSFDHHATVAKLPPTAQTELLDQAEKETLSTAAFKKLRKEKFPDESKPSKTPKVAPKGWPELTAPKDEDKALKLADILIAYFEEAEGKTPAKDWDKERLKHWESRLAAIRRFHRRTGLQK